MEGSVIIIAVKAFAAAIAIMTMYGTSKSLSYAIEAIVNAMAKNPAVKDDIKGLALIMLAFIEATGLLIAGVAFVIIFGI